MNNISWLIDIIPAIAPLLKSLKVLYSNSLRLFNVKIFSIYSQYTSA
ncbi:MAG: hypothetical protein WCD53_05340 [Microcoleus sp.]